MQSLQSTGSFPFRDEIFPAQTLSYVWENRAKETHTRIMEADRATEKGTRVCDLWDLGDVLFFKFWSWVPDLHDVQEKKNWSRCNDTSISCLEVSPERPSVGSESPSTGQGLNEQNTVPRVLRA